MTGSRISVIVIYCAHILMCGVVMTIFFAFIRPVVYPLFVNYEYTFYPWIETDRSDRQCQSNCSWNNQDWPEAYHSLNWQNEPLVLMNTGKFGQNTSFEARPTFWELDLQLGKLWACSLYSGRCHCNPFTCTVKLRSKTSISAWLRFPRSDFTILSRTPKTQERMADSSKFFHHILPDRRALLWNISSYW